MSVEPVVRDFLRNELGRDASAIGRDQSLLESGTLDSVSVMQLVAFLESTYGITVPDEDMTPDNFDTIAAITAFVERRQAERRG